MVALPTHDQAQWPERKRELVRSMRSMEGHFQRTGADLLACPSEEGQDYRLLYEELRKVASSSSARKQRQRNSAYGLAEPQ